MQKITAFTVAFFLLLGSVIYLVGCNEQPPRDEQVHVNTAPPKVAPSIPFWDALQNEDWDTVRRWIEYDPSLVNSKGVFINRLVFRASDRSSTIERQYYGVTPLMVAVLRHDFEMVKFLCEKGADLNMRCNTPQIKGTALHYLILWGLNERDMEIGHYLIDRGADVNVKDANQETPLQHLASIVNKSERDIKMMQRLKAAGGR